MSINTFQLLLTLEIAIITKIYTINKILRLIIFITFPISRSAYDCQCEWMRRQ